jgi:hypothetical protein
MNSLITLFPELANLPKASLDPASLPEEFAKSTLLALQAQQDILSLELYEQDPMYRAKLTAKSQLAASQILAQLRLDENRLKTREVVVDFYEQLKEALDEYRRNNT